VRRAAGLGPSIATASAVAAARWPDRPAVIDADGELTYGELATRVEALAGGLHHQLGLTADDVVAVLCRNHRGYVVAMLALARLGADTVFANTELPPDQVVAIFERHGVRTAIVDDDLAAKLDEGGWTGTRVGSRTGPSSIDDLAARGRPLAGPAPRTPRMILLTSGTTGLPKGVPRAPSGQAIAGPLVSVVGGLGLRSGDRVLIAPPLFHGFGLGLLGITLSIGATVVLAPRFDAEEAIATIERHGVGVAAVVPLMLRRLLQVPDGPSRASTLRAVLSGGAPLPPPLAAAFMDAFGDVLLDGYGASEVGIATIARPSDLRAAPGTVGRPVWGTTVLVVDDAGRPAPAGATGRFLVGCPTAENGRLEPSDTGDLGHLDAAGRLFIDGRADDMVVSGGENVYPRHVADALSAHPAVADVAVVGVADEEFGQRLRAFVVAAEPVSVDELLAHVRARCARYEVPREVVLVDELPRNATGKLLTSRLTEG
jgi:fatty-acyl-CoA synthase